MFKNILPKLFFPVLLLALVGVLCYSNYAPGTFLTGWDNLHPEFNFSLYLKRAFFGAWQEHQGIGAPAAQAFASDLTRLPIVYFLTLTLPVNLVRYSFFFLTLAVGVLGMYFLARYFLSEHSKKYIGGASFLAAVFYLLNLGTLQQYFDPLEMFAVHFATLPWLLFTASKYLKESGRKNLIWFSLMTLLSSSMAHTATLFYAYLAAFGLFVGTNFLLNRKKAFLKRGIVLVILTLALNLFWLAPNIYYVVNEAGTVENSKISRTFSDEAYLQSRAFGNIESLGILKNFPFNWREYDYSTNSFEDLMRVWDAHLANLDVTLIGYGAVIFALLGIIIASFRKSKFALSLLPVLAISTFFWLADIPKEYSLIREALRFPFTKFSILMTSVLSIFLAFSSQFIMSILGRVKMSFVFVIFGVLSLVYFMRPAFQGNFIDPQMKVKIPDEYFQMFKWFEDKDPGARVAKLPLQTFWDWNFYSWGYQGGGFTWFGIPQPTLDREFDRWGKYNEDFYSQASNALYGNDPAGFNLALKKYQVKYLMLDESLINAGGSADLLYISQIKKMLSDLGIKEVVKFDHISIYDTGFEVKNVSAPKTEINNVPEPLIKKDLIISDDTSVNKGFKEAYNCDIKKVGSVFKQNSDQGIDYKADGGGVSCDYINFENLKYNEPYILRVVGQNLKGRSLKVYFTNYKTGRAEIEELLPNGNFDKEFYIYPKNIVGAGYSLNFETRSYSPIGSENIVRKVEIYDAVEVHSAGIQGQSLKAEQNIQNDLTVSDVKKYGTWAYVVKTEGSGLLELGQGYEEGWIAMGNGHFLPHSRFNGWANAWTVPSGIKYPISSIYIFYWPQLLEWLGMGIAAVSLALIIL